MAAYTWTTENGQSVCYWNGFKFIFQNNTNHKIIIQIDDENHSNVDAKETWDAFLATGATAGHPEVDAHLKDGNPWIKLFGLDGKHDEILSSD